MRIEIEKPKNPKCAIGNPKFSRPMLFARNALASGPQAYLCPDYRIAKAKVGKGIFLLDMEWTIC